ncbi:hypothetical protein J2S40_001606 [Nocardioides luteus]|uniref:DUF5615 domain-containing protein n=1 Tax=Nocardioides luteus TaxID=1844 RepID=A0ABQ5T0Q9_9ACTN|nr:hypothetical protein [Nocardioides luteus]MDR7310548.1 hypothetical protein [Nocardioides luteus]GGR42086.1 hypothetical protein GCM10010197_04470 [Nocardioides luteus]GLJ69671.1 hypothetical protein GCM10017579_37070 [Nocardioides luteus]
MRLLLDENLSEKLVPLLEAADHDATAPSFVLIRRLIGRRVPEIASVIVDNLEDVEADLLAGAVVVFGDETMRIRRLPIG